MGTAICQDTCGAGDVVDIALDVTETNAIWVTTMGSVVTAPSAMAMRMGTVIGTVQGTPKRVARDASHAYVTSTNTPAAALQGWITAVSLPGGATTVLAKLDCAPFGIATDGVNVYWTCSDGSVRGVSALP